MIDDALNSENRKKTFAIQIDTNPKYCDKGEILVSVTRNGYQWTSISLLPNEIEDLVDRLQKIINTPKQPKEI